MHSSSWQWADHQGHAFLTCKLLNSWPHGFFTRNFWPQVPEDLTPALHPQAAVQRVKQVHGSRVLTPTEMAQMDAESTHPEADALMSDGPNQALWVCSADCNPVLIGDCVTGQAAAIHAGWRGTALKIVPQAVAKMQAQGSRLADLRVAIGPAIAGEVYQVATTVAAEVGRTIAPGDHNSDEALVEALQSLAHSPILPDDESGKARLDVRQVNVWQLTQLGLSLAQISVAPHCTFQEPERFFSYRRTGEKQVQWSGIVSRTAA
ncbi:laccase [Leptolyngbya sp. BL0902]|uniref:peptidoglycan editing factor PgeF n=1 Tax=Leptolyngbya sp. BL0902 TaxID=1115757 RepID=UPI0018E76DA3|nr:peptidoglycan editing factor PgeF [Leptolyngbya sp. BL0902]QQE63800.1 laccase [Leptolyngbya sp. BL0902]